MCHWQFVCRKTDMDWLGIEVGLPGLATPTRPRRVKLWKLPALYLNVLLLPRKENCFSIIESQFIMLLRDTICIYLEKRMKLVQVAELCKSNSDFFEY